MKNMRAFLLIVTAGLCMVPGSYASEVPVASRFTSFFMGGASTGFHPSFAALSEDTAFTEEATQWVQAALSAVPHLNFTPLGRGPAGGVKVSAKVEPNTLFIRGLVSRADIKKVAHFSTDEYVFSTNVTLEFFDLVSGEVFYTRTLTGQVFKETPRGRELPSGEIDDLFRTCLKGTVENVVRQVGQGYQPGVLEGHIVVVADTSTVVLDMGRADGLYQGMTFYFYDDPGGTPVGMIRTEAPQDRLCKAGIIVSQGAAPERGWTVRSFGVNRLNRQKGQTRYMVADFSSADPKRLPPGFEVDAQELGQWLHDGLSRHTDLFMLTPLLARLDSQGAVQVQEALWEAQTNYSVFGGLAQSTVLGRRAFPDIMVKGVIAHADIQSYATPGADNKILEVGISIEFYDRKTRDFLYSCQHSGRKVEKIVKEGGKVYRDLNLAASFRDLCKEVVREASLKIGEAYRPGPIQGRVASLEPGDTFSVTLPGRNAYAGDLFNVVRESESIAGLAGEDLGRLWKPYGIAKLTERTGEDKFAAKLLVSDGTTQVREGDLLRAEGRQANLAAGTLCQVVGWRVKGKICDDYICSPPRLMEWLHDALLSTGKFRLLPPNFREEDAATAEVALTSGQFETRDQREIIYQGVRTPEILISGRLGLADVKRKVGEFKDVLKLRSGLEITFTNTAGDTLFSRKLVGSRNLERVKSRGKTVIGTKDLSPDFDKLAHNTIRELVERIAVEYAP